MSLAKYHGVERRREDDRAPLKPRPVELVVRCIAERRENYWQAFSLEFGLAVQGESLPEVKRRLEAMLVSYVYDALIGEDREYAFQLLTRRATFGVYAKYYIANALTHTKRVLGSSKNTFLFSEPLPLSPVCIS